jgi:quinol monooxygenase YgiN
MYVTITSLRLHGPFHFFRLSWLALQIVKQLRANRACLRYRSKGVWTLHYTMSLWQDQASLKAFAREGAHLAAMKQSGRIAAEIKTYTFPAEQLPDWRQAQQLLKEKGKLLTYAAGSK